MLQHCITQRPMLKGLGRVFFLVVVVGALNIFAIERTQQREGDAPVEPLLAAAERSQATGKLMSGLKANGDTIPIPVDDSWRRTSVGWERKEDWQYLTVSPARKKLSLKTLIQRTWPATLAATELTLVLAILFLKPTLPLGESRGTRAERAPLNPRQDA